MRRCKTQKSLYRYVWAFMGRCKTPTDCPLSGTSVSLLAAKGTVDAVAVTGIDGKFEADYHAPSSGEMIAITAFVPGSLAFQSVCISVIQTGGGNGNGNGNANGNGIGGTTNSVVKPEESKKSVEVGVDPALSAEGELEGIVTFKLPAGAAAGKGLLKAAVVPKDQVPPPSDKLKSVSQMLELSGTTGIVAGSLLI